MCLFFGFYGISKAYSSIRQVGFGEYRNAIEYNNGTIKIFDYEMEIKNMSF